uniref:Uncharacterized protein n=1 Tax=Tetranychus urticae TaxID=32264 RepID=T1KG45_TETUR
MQYLQFFMSTLIFPFNLHHIHQQKASSIHTKCHIERL